MNSQQSFDTYGGLITSSTDMAPPFPSLALFHCVRMEIVPISANITAAVDDVNWEAFVE